MYDEGITHMNERIPHERSHKCIYSGNFKFGGNHSKQLRKIGIDSVENILQNLFRINAAKETNNNKSIK